MFVAIDGQKHWFGRLLASRIPQGSHALDARGGRAWQHFVRLLGGDETAQLDNKSRVDKKTTGLCTGNAQ